MLDDSHKCLSDAIRRTIAYSDVFEHPLRAREIHRYLIGFRISLEELKSALDKERSLVRRGEYWVLPGREEIIPIRLQREVHSRKLMPRALRIGRILGSLPFVRMVALTGSLAVLNISKTDDFDYMLVTVPGRVWTARAFALLVNRIAKVFGHTICPNLIVSANALEWPLHDLYSARELSQMVPISGLDVYRKLIHANTWAADILPNAFRESNSELFEGLRGDPRLKKQAPIIQKHIEFLLGGKLGNRLEEWEMDRKIRRFSKQEGFGEETVFNAQLCQGNFHHHRKWTQEIYESKLSALVDVQSAVINSQSPGATTRANVP
jgi:hypothetical protein